MDDVRAMRLAVQVNLAHLKVADARRRGIDPGAHEIEVSSPGFVSDFRETLIDHRVVTGYTDQEVRLRLREIWGQFCLLGWVLGEGDDAARCETAMAAKHAEIHALLWRLRYEQRLRERAAPGEPASAGDEARLAAEIPAVALGEPVGDASDEAVLLAACEHAGMLAAIRWCTDRTRRWGADGIMAVADSPF